MQLIRVLKPTFGQTLRSYPFVFKKISIYFGIYFFLLSSLFYAGGHFLFNLSETNFQTQNLFYFSLPLLFAHLFLIFMIPYYGYHYNTQSAPPFWDFIGNKVWPLILNQIKAVFVILFFLLLLIVPGIYKAIRLFFLTETVFFDKNPGGFLKKTGQCSKGYFWLSFVFIVFTAFISGLIGVLSLLCTKALPIFFALPALCLFFYIKSFMILFKNQLYFQIKKDRGEEVSLS